MSLALIGNAVTAGIMLSTVIGIVPMMLAVPYGRYVEMIQFLWPRYDPFMPIVHALTCVLNVVLAVVAPSAAQRTLFGAAAVTLAVVMAISVIKNVPVNRYVMSLDPQHRPEDWAQRDPRRRWRNWNLARTSLALAALAANAVGAALG